MIELPDLYPYQSDVRDRARAALARHMRIILCGQTGTGKTRIAKWILGSSANREPSDGQSGRSLFTVHRRGLVDNAIDEFKKEPVLPHGVIMSGRDAAYGYRVQVASVDSLLSWFVEDDEYQNDLTFDLIVPDECHSHHDKYARFLKYHDAKREELGLHPAYVIGLSATAQAKGLADVYKEIIQGPPTQWLIDNKHLSPFRYFRATEGKLGLLVKRGGEFTKASEALAMDGLAGDLERDWRKFAEDRPTVGFFPRRSHAKEAMTLLQAKGLSVEYVDGNTLDEERRQIFSDLNKHYIDYLCNVQVVERGTDIPAIACVQLCVAVGSLVRYRQMIGRGSRFDLEKYPDKKDCVLIDHGGNIQRHEPYGFFEDDPPWSLDVTTKDPGEVGSRPSIECPKCQALYRGGRCAHCGYEPTSRERRAQGLVFDGSELQEVTRKESKAKVRTAEELMVSALYASAQSGCFWKQCFKIYKQSCEKQGTPHNVPRTVEVAGHRYKMLPFGSEDAGRKVAILYPFFLTGEHGGEYLIQESALAGEPY